MSSDVSARRAAQAGPSATRTAAGTPSVRPDSVRRWARAVAGPAAAGPHAADAPPGSDQETAASADASSEQDDVPAQPAVDHAALSRPLHRLRGQSLAEPAPWPSSSGRARPPATQDASQRAEHDESEAVLADDPSPHAGPTLTEEQTLPLLALRGRHGSHRDARGDEGAARDTTEPERKPGSEPPASAAPAAAMATSMHTASSDAADTVASTSEQLQSLIASCCDRLWVSDGANGVPQGLMLDLGRWMPGCTLEVAKAAGALRISMRGVEGDRAESMEKELDALGDDLAARLGCRVVVAVDRQKKYPG